MPEEFLKIAGMGGLEGRTSVRGGQARRWRFGSAEFDEGRWTLTVAGRPAHIEGKPLDVLLELLTRGGAVASKDELLAAVWPETTVVEGSLTTAVLKLRRALKDPGGEQAIIKTAPRVGYRLAVPVEVDWSPLSAEPQAAVPAVLQSDAVNRFGRAVLQPDRDPTSRLAQGALRAAAGLMLALLLGLSLASWTTRETPRSKSAGFTHQDAVDAVRQLDVTRIEALLRMGWDPNTPFDREGNGALNILLGVCEWDPQHDQRRLMLMARTLIDGGAKLDARNVWGDTAYSIAKAPRYCGPDHPVTHMLHTLCYAGYRPLGDKCLAVRHSKRAVD
jgi:DNA-binding winged helix-turn-helix (wHTH) protein